MVHIQRDDPADVQTVFDKVRTQPITAVESGVADYTSIKDCDLVGPPTTWFDGFFYNVIIFVTSG